MPTRAASVPVTSTYWPVAVTAAGKAGSLHIGESKLTIVIMDSGLALGGPGMTGVSNRQRIERAVSVRAGGAVAVVSFVRGVSTLS